MNMLVAGVGLAGDALFDTVCAGGVNMGWMDWQPEIVYAVLGAVVTGVLGWIVRGLRVKPQMKVLKMQEEQRERTWLRRMGF